VQNYQAAQTHLPPPSIPAPSSTSGSGFFHPWGSVFVVLLQHLEDADRYAAFNLSEQVASTTNLPITSALHPIYLCPSMLFPRDVPAVDCNEKLAPGSYLISTRTDYASFALHDPAVMNGAFKYPTPGKPYDLDRRQFTDGTSKTLLAGETDYGLEDLLWGPDECSARAHQVKWGDQTWADGYWFYGWGHINWDAYRLYGLDSYNATRGVANDVVKTQRVFRSDHPGGAQFVFVDGSVRFVPETIDYPVLRALVTRAGEETDYDF
jgi:prepilin-type processing-associated H-X9-DG protein